MEVSALNEKIIFQRNEIVTDNIGNHTNVWREYYSCFSTISGESGTEKNAEGTILDDVDIGFTVRWCEQISRVNSLEFRIIFHDEIYNIILVDHLNFKKKAVKFKCQKVRI